MSAKLKDALSRLDERVDQTPTNVKAFMVEPPDGLTLYVKYRGDISPGEREGRDETPLGPAPKNIQGKILDSRVIPGAQPSFMIALRVTKSPDTEDVGRVISIYPTRDQISLYPFSRIRELVHKKMNSEDLKKLRGFADIHNQLAYLPYDEDGRSGMAGRETIKAKSRFEGKRRPAWPRLGHPELGEYYHDDYQGSQYDESMKKSGRVQDVTGNSHIDDEMLGGRRRRRKRKTKRKSRKSKRRRRKKRKTIRKRKSRRKIRR